MRLKLSCIKVILYKIVCYYLLLTICRLVSHRSIIFLRWLWHCRIFSRWLRFFFIIFVFWWRVVYYCIFRLGIVVLATIHIIFFLYCIILRYIYWLVVYRVFLLNNVCRFYLWCFFFVIRV